MLGRPGGTEGARLTLRPAPFKGRLNGLQTFNRIAFPVFLGVYIIAIATLVILESFSSTAVLAIGVLLFLGGGGVVQLLMRRNSLTVRNGAITVRRPFYVDATTPIEKVARVVACILPGPGDESESRPHAYGG